MDIELSPIEARVLSVLIEKAATTPDYYPLSLSAVVSACNQKSNREPVMSLGETQTIEALDSLIAKRLVWEKTPSGSRVTKYAHRLSNTLGLTYDFSSNELGVLCVLMLRGAQTVGEIRGRSGRLCDFSSLSEVEETLTGLMEREGGARVAKLPREPGRKESRYAHLLCGAVQIAQPVAASPGASVEETSAAGERIMALERTVADLRTELEEIKRQLGN